MLVDEYYIILLSFKIFFIMENRFDFVKVLKVSSFVYIRFFDISEGSLLIDI